MERLLSFCPAMVRLWMFHKNREGTEWSARTAATVLPQWPEGLPWARCPADKTGCLACEGDTHWRRLRTSNYQPGWTQVPIVTTDEMHQSRWAAVL